MLKSELEDFFSGILTQEVAESGNDSDSSSSSDGDSSNDGHETDEIDDTLPDEEILRLAAEGLPDDEETSTKRKRGSAKKGGTTGTPGTGAKRGRKKKDPNAEPSSKKRKTETGAKGTRKKKEPTEYKKGKWNPKVTEITESKYLDSLKTEIFSECCVTCTNRNVIRAVKTGNMELFKKLLTSNRLISTTQQAWSCDHLKGAFEYALERKDKEMITLLANVTQSTSYYHEARDESEEDEDEDDDDEEEEEFDYGSRPFSAGPKLSVDKSKKLTYRKAYPGRVLLKWEGTGQYNPMTFSHKVRALKMSRGGREGNNAFLADTMSTTQRDDHFFNRSNDVQQLVLNSGYDQEFADFLKLSFDWTEAYNQNVVEAIRGGHRELAAHIIGNITDMNNYGFSKYHLESLTLSEGEKMSDIRTYTSTTKKAVGNLKVTPMHCAAINPAKEFLANMIEINNGDYNVADESGRKPIHYAAACTEDAPLKYLLELGANYRELDNMKTTPLMIAAEHGRAQNIKALCEHNSELKSHINLKDKSNLAAIHIAVRAGKLESVKALCETVPKTMEFAGRDRMTPLHWAAAHGHYEIVEWMVENKAKVTKKDKFKRTPLSLAVRNGYTKIVNYLLRKGSEFNEPDTSANYPLHYACAYGWDEMIDQLLQAGADVNAKNDWNITPLGIAVLKNHFSCIKKLLEIEGVDVNCKDNDGRSLLVLWIQNLDEKSYERIEYLITKKKADVTIKDLDGESALSYLLKRSYDSQNSCGLSESQQQELDKKILRLLLDHGDTTDSDCNGCSPFEVVFSQRKYHLMKFLLEEGGKSSIRNSQGQNLFHVLLNDPWDSKAIEFLKSVIEDGILDAPEQLKEIDNRGLTPFLTIFARFVERASGFYHEPQRPYRNNSYYGFNYGYSYDAEARKRQEEQAERKYQQKKADALLKYKEKVSEFVELVKYLISQGANPADVVAKLKQYREKEEENGSKMDIDNPSSSTTQKNAPVQSMALRDYYKPTNSNGNPWKYQESHYDGTYGKWTLLHFAVYYPEWELIDFIETLDGCDYNARNSSNESVWMWTFDSSFRYPPGIETSEQKNEFRNNLMDHIAKELSIEQISFDENDEPYLIRVIKSKQNHLRDLLFAKGVDLNCRNSGGATPLMTAIAVQDEDTIEYLIKSGVDINAKNSSGDAIIFQSIRKNYRAFELLLEKGVCLDVVDKENNPPLVVAVQEGEYEMVQDLLNKGVEINCVDGDGVSILIRVVKMRHHKILDLLLENNIDVKVTSKTKGYSPLLMATKGSEMKMITSLIKAGDDINVKDEKDKCLLMYAMKDNNLNFFNLLLSHNVNLDVSNSLGNCPLIIAIKAGSVNMTASLIAKGVDVNAVDHKGNPGIMIALRAKQYPLIELLLNTEALDINCFDETGYSPILFCVKNQLTRYLKKLIEKGANINDKDKEGLTCLHYAINDSDSTADATFDFPEELIEYGADINALDNLGRTPLHYNFVKIDQPFNTSAIDPIEIVSSLCGVDGIRLDVVDEWGKTALHYASQRGAAISALYLLERDADINRADAHGNTPLAISFLAGHPNYAILLLQKKASVDVSAHIQSIANYPGSLCPKMREGTYSLFRISVNRKWQGLTYTLIDKKYNFMNAMEDGMNEGQFRLVANLLKKNPPGDVLRKENQLKQNLFHVLALNGTNAPPELTNLIAKQFLKRGIPINTQDSGEKTPLMYAARKNYTTLTAFILSQEGDLNVVDDKGMSALILAARKNNDRIVKQLVECGSRIDPNIKDEGNLTALIYGAKNGNRYTVTNLISSTQHGGSKVQLDFQDPEGNTALHIACSRGHAIIAMSLVAAGADRTLLNNEGDTPLILAARSGSYDCIREIAFNSINSGLFARKEYQPGSAEIVNAQNTQGETALHIVTRRSDAKLVRLLVTARTDLSLIDSEGETALHIASSLNQREVLATLLMDDENRQHSHEDYQVEDIDTSMINLQKPNGDTALHLLCRLSYADHKLVKILLAAGADCNLVGKGLQTPLHIVCEAQNYDLPCLLLDCGARADLEDHRGYQPLQYLYRTSVSESLYLKTPDFVKAGADLNRLVMTETTNSTTTVITAEVPDEELKTLNLPPLQCDQIKQLRKNRNSKEKEALKKKAWETGKVVTQTVVVYSKRSVGWGENQETRYEKTVIQKSWRSVLLFALLEMKSKKWVEMLLCGGIGVNARDVKGMTALMHLAKENRGDLIRLFLKFDGHDKEAVDHDGKSVIHYVINPREFGSWENTTVLTLLAKAGFKLDIPDASGRTPIWFSFRQRSGRMEHILRLYGVTEERQKIKETKFKKSQTTVGVEDWPESTYVYEEDAEHYMEKVKKEAEETALEEKIPADSVALDDPSHYEVIYDEEAKEPYDALMTKIDLSNGEYGENLFYKMQLVVEKNRNTNILITRWGRIGDDGQFQRTPFGDKEKAIKEFCDVFKKKTSNEWAKRHEFEKKRGKYQLLLFEKVVISDRELLKPFNLDEDAGCVESDLPEEVQGVMNQIANVSMYKRALTARGIDTDIMPLGCLTKEFILKGKALLTLISEYIDLMKDMYAIGTKTPEEVQKLLEVKEKISEYSSRFYEIIPHTQFRRAAVLPIDNESSIKEKMDLLDSLHDYELASKILYGAHFRAEEINPLDYIYKALDIRLHPIQHNSGEFRTIESYIRNSNTRVQIKNIFMLQRKGEAEKIEQWKHVGNNALLFHGSKLSNFLGILSQGLRIAPPEAPVTGYMFGKGVYFADTFNKSFGYCNDVVNDRGLDKYMLLCEAALGKPMPRKRADYIDYLPNAEYQCTHGIGRNRPVSHKNLMLDNGIRVPVGELESNPDHDLALNYNEFIIYDTTQIRMRYLIQVSNNSYY